jgi:hypothetical protein
MEPDLHLVWTAIKRKTRAIAAPCGEFGNVSRSSWIAWRNWFHQSTGVDFCSEVLALSAIR